MNNDQLGKVIITMWYSLSTEPLNASRGNRGCIAIAQVREAHPLPVRGIDDIITPT
jgi:hypothetical protein